MLEQIDFSSKDGISILDFGCGFAGLKKHIDGLGLDLDYTGADAGKSFIDFCRSEIPESNFHYLKSNNDISSLGSFDYVVCCGVWTVKNEVKHEDMFSMFSEDIKKLWKITNKGIAFNLMATHVDWERDDLFHVSMDTLAGFLCKEVTRDFVIRNDYGLYEYTVYLRKNNEG